MPYIQIEVNKHYPTATKKQLAKTIGEVYSKIMQASVKRLTVTIREPGEGAVWRCREEDPEK